MKDLSGKELFFLALSLLFVLFIFLSTTPASVFHGDTGETITASLTLGIQHPPGYPLHTIVGKLFSFLPYGDISMRIYVYSMFLTLMTMIIIFFFCRELASVIFKNNTGAFFPFITPMIFSTGFFIWEQSIIAKGGLYMMNIMFTSLISLILLKAYVSDEKKKFFFLFSFVYGLSLTNHHMSQLAILPAYIFMLYASGFFRLTHPSNIAVIILLFITGFSAYLFLPIRAESAILNWGEPDTFGNFIKVFSRYQYLMAEGTRSLSRSFSQASKFFSSLSYNFLFIGLIPAAAGVYYLYKKNRDILIFLLSIPALFLLITSIYLNLKPERLYIMETYITVVYLPVAVLSGIGISAYLKKRAFAISAVIVLLGLNLFFFYPKLDKSRYFFAYDYNRNILDSLEPGSLLFMTGDGVVFPMWYLKYAKHVRQDVTLIGSAVLPMQWVRDNIKRQNPSVSVPAIANKKIGRESTGYIINSLIKRNISRFPIYFSYNLPEEHAMDGGFRLMPKGLVHRVLPGDAAKITPSYIKSNQNLWKYYNKRSLLGTYEYFMDKKTEEIYMKDYAIIANSAGTFFEDSSYYPESLYFFTLAHKLRPYDHEYFYNMGNGYYNLKDYSKAIEMYKKCLELKDDYENAWFNLGVARYTLKDYSKALEAFRKVKELDPAREKIDSYISMMEKFKTAGNQ